MWTCIRARPAVHVSPERQAASRGIPKGPQDQDVSTRTHIKKRAPPPIIEYINVNTSLPVQAGPIPDRLTIWPVDDGRYGLDATFQGASGYQRAEHHQTALNRDGVPHKFVQELNGGWTLRFGPLRGIDVASALAAFVY